MICKPSFWHQYTISPNKNLEVRTNKNFAIKVANIL